MIGLEHHKTARCDSNAGAVSDCEKIRARALKTRLEREKEMHFDVTSILEVG